MLFRSHSFRNYGDYLLIGGGKHRTGKQKEQFTQLQQYAKELYPNQSIAYNWAAQDCMSLDGIPYIGQYSRSTPHIFVATGFNKWGMSTSMVSAMIISDLIQGKGSPYEEVFDPKRVKVNGQLFLNGWETTMALLALKKKRCSHLGCALTYNKQEHTWDCPCHGSRFSEDGDLIDNPATKGLK